MRCVALLFVAFFSINQISGQGIQINSQGQGIEFFHGTWEEALEQAQIQDKVIFVDAYTTWCGPCKRMSKNVFPSTLR